MEEYQQSMSRPRLAAPNSVRIALLLVCIALLSWGLTNSCVRPQPDPPEDNGSEIEPEIEEQEPVLEEEPEPEPEQVPKLQIAESYVLLSISQTSALVNVRNIGVAGVDPEFIWDISIPTNNLGLTSVPRTGRLGVGQEVQVEISAESFDFADTQVITLTVEARANSNGGTSISRDQKNLDVILVGAGIQETVEVEPEIEADQEATPFDEALSESNEEHLLEESGEDEIVLDDSEQEDISEPSDEVEFVEEPPPALPIYFLSLATSPEGSSQTIEIHETEPNDTSSDQGVINIGVGPGWPVVTASGNLDPKGDVDLYAILLTSNLVLLANVDTPNLSENFVPFLFLLGTDGSTVLASSNDTGDLLADLAASPQPYFIAVLNAADRLSEIEAESPSDIEVEVEPEAETSSEAP